MYILTYLHMYFEVLIHLSRVFTFVVKVLYTQFDDFVFVCLCSSVLLFASRLLSSEVSVAMQSKVGLGSLAGVIHPYPTRAESIRQAGDLYNKTKLTPVVRSLFRNLMAIKR